MARVLVGVKRVIDYAVKVGFFHITILSAILLVIFVIAVFFSFTLCSIPIMKNNVFRSVLNLIKLGL